MSEVKPSDIKESTFENVSESNEEINNYVAITPDSPHYKNYLLVKELINKLSEVQKKLNLSDGDNNEYVYSFYEVRSGLMEIEIYLSDKKYIKYMERVNSENLNSELESLKERIFNLPTFLIDTLILELNAIDVVISEIVKEIYLKEKIVDFEGEINSGAEKLKRLESYIDRSNTLLKDLRNTTIMELYDRDYKKFSKISLFYEIGFYLLVLMMFFYFFGLTFYVRDIDLGFLQLSFPVKSHAPDLQFYIQKISTLILATTLIAFLLKRSFMNRRLADESFRTSKELSGLPRYIEDLSPDMQDKIRFDLAYKYFGNSIHNESYTGSENLMHENIKANTDFIKALKDLTPKVEGPKADNAPKDLV